MLTSLTRKVNLAIRQFKGYKYARDLLENIEILAYKPSYYRYYHINYYGTSESYEINAPIHLPLRTEFQVKNIIRQDNQISIQQPYYFFVDRAFVLPRSPLVIDKRGNLLLEQLSGHLRFSPRLWPLSLDASPHGCDRVIENAIVVNGQNSRNYFHWYFDALAKLEGLDYVDNGWRKYKFLVTRKPSDWQEESLRLLGINKKQIIVADDERIMINNLLVLSPRRNAFRFSRVNLQWLRRKMLGSLGIYNYHPKQKIFINRKYNEDRRIVNYGELEKVILKRGFTIKYMQDLSLQEKVKLLRSADVVAGIHGAGMTNIIWGDSPKVMELYSDLFTTEIYSLAGALNLDYYCMKGRPKSKGKRNREDFYVDISALEYFLDSVEKHHLESGVSSSIFT